MTDFIHRAGHWETINPPLAGWRYLSLRIVTERLAASGGQEEVAFVLLSGRCRIVTDETVFELGPRTSVFDGLPWTLYLPPDTDFEIEPLEHAEIAACGARSERRGKPLLIEPDQVEIETRGAGNATRQINHIIAPDFPAGRLLIVEVLTPGGNWSSTPPHKHEVDDPPCEAELEEIYYYRLRKREGFALQRLYSPARSLDLTERVGDGDVLLVPFGYHVTVASPGYDLYYLNALAGDRRSMAAADDPDFAWQRAAWRQMAPDPRVPLVGP